MNKYWTIAVVIFGTILIIIACSDIGNFSAAVPNEAETTAGEAGDVKTRQPTSQATTQKGN